MANLEDALVIVEACLSEVLHHIFRSPRQRKLQDLICSGNTFVYAEIPTDAGNWDDGKDWKFLGREDRFFVERERFSRDGLSKKLGTFVLSQSIGHYRVLFQRKHSERDLEKTFLRLQASRDLAPPGFSLPRSTSPY